MQQITNASDMVKLSSSMLDKPYYQLIQDIESDAYTLQKSNEADESVFSLFDAVYHTDSTPATQELSLDVITRRDYPMDRSLST